MRTTVLTLALALAAAPLLSLAQSTIPGSYPTGDNAAPLKAATTSPKIKKSKKQEVPMKPLSRLALGGGISTSGGGSAQVATNLNRFLNLRATGSFFEYTDNNISTNGFNITGKLNFATGGASLDFFPFPTHGFRLSPGVQFYNQNRVTAAAVVTSGDNISLNGTKYYSDSTNTTTGSTPIAMTGRLGLNTNKTAFTMTTGWGNVIPRKGGHWAFPFELGAAFTGAPTLNIGLSGWACTDAALTNCSNLASTSNTISQQVNTNLNAQIATWKNDLDLLKVYPIVSFGVTYNFAIRK